ncbi:hypothetical protein McanMca71_005868 [Microsporum canis]
MSGVAEDAACDSRTASVGLAPAKGVQRPISQAGDAGKQASANWNNVRKGKVRTVLRRPAPKSVNSFNKVNGQYWRSGSASEDESEAGAQEEGANSLAKDGSDIDSESSTEDTTDPSDIDENDSSILLNMDQPSTENAQLESQVEPQPVCINQENVDMTSVAEVVEEQGALLETVPPVSNDDNIDAAAQKAFRSKYSITPRTIAELETDDFKKQSSANIAVHGRPMNLGSALPGGGARDAENEGMTKTHAQHLFRGQLQKSLATYVAQTDISSPSVT